LRKSDVAAAAAGVRDGFEKEEEERCE